jgi:hypothetical protein
MAEIQSLSRPSGNNVATIKDFIATVRQDVSEEIKEPVHPSGIPGVFGRRYSVTGTANVAPALYRAFKR